MTLIIKFLYFSIDKIDKKAIPLFHISLLKNKK